ncbi:hypothetical protein AB0M41_09025 [Streptomyces sp. NPDC051896]|uniref:hypothetical protein n=1 Tax=Streptomyces sp. NPDC051896 TaxID=3155416 RepID=UPI003413FE90
MVDIVVPELAPVLGPVAEARRRRAAAVAAEIRRARHASERGGPLHATARLVTRRPRAAHTRARFRSAATGRRPRSLLAPRPRAATTAGDLPGPALKDRGHALDADRP